MKFKVLWALTAVASAAPLLPRFDNPGLYFKDGTFQITVFNDLHVGDNGVQPGELGDRKKNEWSDSRTMLIMNTVMDTEPRTDLAVLNGDLTTCEWLEPSLVYSKLEMIITPFLSRQIPFAATWGNHDWNEHCNTRGMTEYLWNRANNNGHQLTFTTSSPMPGDPSTLDPDKVGTSNYYIPLYSIDSNGHQKLKMLLWFFDSKGGRQYGTNLPVDDWVDDRVLVWFKQTRAQLEADHGGETIPSLVFVHIPPSVTEKFRATQRSRGSATEPGVSTEMIGAQGQGKEDGRVHGDKNFMQALVDTKGLIAVFSGHDHRNDWCMKWSKDKAVADNDPGTGNDIHICFGRHTGQGGYSEIMRGGRRIVIREDMLGKDNTVETWIRLENGQESARVVLNSTYGTDQYSPVEVLLSPSYPEENPSALSSSTLHSTVDTRSMTSSEYYYMAETSSKSGRPTDPSKMTTHSTATTSSQGITFSTSAPMSRTIEQTTKIYSGEPTNTASKDTHSPPLVSLGFQNH